VKRSTSVLMLISLLVGVLLGLGLAKLIVNAAAALAVALLIVGVVVVAVLLLRHRRREWRQERAARHG
jgi:hypothetical protein